MRIRTVAQIAECADAVDAGEIVVLPTRLWYMLCADSTNAEACRRIFEGKGRPTTKPLALVMPVERRGSRHGSRSPPRPTALPRGSGPVTSPCCSRGRARRPAASSGGSVRPPRWSPGILSCWGNWPCGPETLAA